MDKTSMTLGWLVGRQIAGQRRAVQKQPVAYLYNGVRLPPFPEYDKELYPFAYIYTYKFLGSDAYLLHVGKELYYETTDDGVYHFRLSEGMDCTGSANAWSELSEVGYDSGNPVNAEGNLWANFDILNEDGTVALAASEPIPVYE